MTALLYAAQDGHGAAVVLLLKAGAYVDWQDSTGVTALSLASMYGHAMVVEALLARGANTNLQDSNGWTALVGRTRSTFTLPTTAAPAVGHPYPVLARPNTHFRTLFPQMCAASEDHTAIMSRLREAGADGDLTNKDGQTADDVHYYYVQ